MAYPQTANVIPLSIPIKGMNTRDPLAAMDPNTAPWISNYDPEPQFLKVRHGHSIHATLTNEVTILGLGVFGNSALFAYAQDAGTAFNHIYNVTAAGAQLTAAAVHACADNTADEAFLAKYNKRTAFTTEADYADCSRPWDGSTWGAWGFTSGGTVIGSRTVVSYKGRVYIFCGTPGSTEGTYLYYSTLAAVTGACTQIDLSSLFEESDAIVWAARLTSPSNVLDDVLLAIGNGAGEILVYAGDNPGATNWQQVGRFKVSKPLFYNSAIEYRNDIWLATETGMISLRKLFTEGGQDLDSVSVSGAIDSYWTKVVKAVVTASGSMINTAASIAYWPEQNKIFCLIKGGLDRDDTYVASGGTLFVYNEISGAWIPQLIPSVAQGYRPSLTYFANGLYYAINNKVMRVSPTAYKDQQWDDPAVFSQIEYSIESAYVDLGTQNKQVVGFEPIIKTDFTGTSVTMKAVADFGRKVSAASTVPLVSGYQIPHYSVGNVGRFIQYRLAGNADIASSLGLELYSMGVAVK